MRYADGGGLTAERRAAREGIRLEAGVRFARGDRTSDIAKDLRVSERSVEQWRRNWREGGIEGLKSKGPAKLPKLSDERFALLEKELAKGPAAHSFPGASSRSATSGRPADRARTGSAVGPSSITRFWSAYARRTGQDTGRAPSASACAADTRGTARSTRPRSVRASSVRAKWSAGAAPSRARRRVRAYAAVRQTAGGPRGATGDVDSEDGPAAGCRGGREEEEADRTCDGVPAGRRECRHPALSGALYEGAGEGSAVAGAVAGHSGAQEFRCSARV
ncbi:hypothetical protein SAVCW2_00210 [Streptomyces avermitilis]|nr:hypothetical protein SAVCW2_00210 [Streptomyces avermitilis]